MKKLITLIAVIVLIAAGVWAAYSFTEKAPTAEEIVVSVSTDVDSLEAELQELEVALAAGDMDEETVAQRYNSITTKLEAIDASVENSEKVTLTTEQREELVTSLEKLRVTLALYSASLAELDTQAGAAGVEKKKKRSSNNNTEVTASTTTETTEEPVVLTEYFEEVVENVEEFVEEVEVVVESETEVEQETTVDETENTEETDTTEEETQDQTETETDTTDEDTNDVIIEGETEVNATTTTEI